MKNRCSLFTLLAVLVALVVVSVAGVAFAQDAQQVRPMFVTVPMHNVGPAPAGAPAALQTFSKSETWKNDPTASKTITEVGTDPSLTNTTTTIPVVIIPIEFVIKHGTGTVRFSALQKLSNGNTAVQNAINSPIFTSGIDWVQGGTDLGNTQYEDAWTRGDWWTNVMTNSSYHLLLGAPTVTTLQVLHVPASKGTVGNPFGKGNRGEVDINYFDAQVQTMLVNLGITPNELPIFMYYNTFLTEGGCCIGGYHSANSNGQTYSTYDYDSAVGSFSQDVSALSHEIGEWIVNPLLTDFACSGYMEVGDPLENEANYGDYPYTLNGFQYHLQDLVFLQYFGQSPSTSVNGWSTFQGTTLGICQNGQ
jgi:hypothetical protein